MEYDLAVQTPAYRKAPPSTHVMNLILTKLLLFQSLVLCCHGQVSPMGQLMSEYHQEMQQARSLGSLGSHEGILQFGAKWLVKFRRSLTDSDGNDPGRAHLTHEASVLAHQQGDHATALLLADEAAQVSAAAGDAEFASLIATNAAMIALDRYATDSTSENRRAALVRFKETKPMLPHLTRNRMTHALEFLQKYARIAKEAKEHQVVLEAYASGLKLLADDPAGAQKLFEENKMRGVPTSFSVEWFLSQKIVQLLCLGKPADDDLEALRTMPGRSRTYSYYLDAISREVWVDDQAKRQAFFKKHSGDDGSRTGDAAAK